MFRCNCDRCGKFISKEDANSDRVIKEDISGYDDHHGKPVYAITCMSCIYSTTTKKEQPCT